MLPLKPESMPLNPPMMEPLLSVTLLTLLPPLVPQELELDLEEASTRAEVGEAATMARVDPWLRLLLVDKGPAAAALQLSGLQATTLDNQPADGSARPPVIP